ncbi:hypothetical protein [Flavobacterium terrisoli]|uniref:hypothetical protein n=1 Tax=Flavobacterium terrisoli TaxID=3242195 RepID=UPI00254344BF|nr:hypothetical protein [Flavobacterium buctense]
MKIFIYPLLIALLPIIVALFLKLLKRKAVPKFPDFLIIILVIGCGIVCTFGSMIVSANGIVESMAAAGSSSRCATGAALFFPIGMIATVIGALMSRKKPLAIF